MQNQHNPISSLPCWKYCKFLLKVSSIDCNITLPLSWSPIQLWAFSLLRCFTFNSCRIWHTLNSTTTNPFHKVLEHWATHAHLSNSVSKFSDISNCWVSISMSNSSFHSVILSNMVESRHSTLFNSTMTLNMNTIICTVKFEYTTSCKWSWHLDYQKGILWTHSRVIVSTGMKVGRVAWFSNWEASNVEQSKILT
jgi:hypothetical protein